ncbi:MAG: Thiol-disulfide oxidoreductase ResA [Elusimicrobia bacterium]|nr:Thiol-disulfide oxidoreductase ResA [Elusimicrobiota bacterium]
MLGAIVLGASFGCQTQADYTSRTVKAPDFQVSDLKGQKITLESLRGKVVFLDFWATWCGPCVISMPEVEKLGEEFRNQDVVILSVSVDANPNSVRRFLAERKVSNRVVMAGNSGIDEKYQVSGIPAFYIIDKKGHVTKAWQGYNPAMASLWRKEISRLLKS